MPTVQVNYLGRLEYREAWELQTRLHREVVARKLARRTDASIAQVHHLLFVEHPPVYTLGKSGSVDHLLLSERELAEQGFTFLRINRGATSLTTDRGSWSPIPSSTSMSFFPTYTATCAAWRRW